MTHETLIHSTLPPLFLAEDMFATSGPKLDIWSMSRNEPVTSFSWGADTITSVKFNPVEVSEGILCCACAALFAISPASRTSGQTLSVAWC